MVNVMLQSADRCKAEAPRRSKSFEEREEEYEKARRRIFHQEQVRSPIKEYHTPSTYLAISSQHLHKIKVPIRPRSMAHSSPKFFGFSARVAVAIFTEYSSIKKEVWVKFG